MGDEKGEYPSFRRIPRLSRECVITEKIDGTNGLIFVGEDGSVRAGSRNRWLSEGQDNYGFFAWVKQNEEFLTRHLGPGHHYGEWWGVGIQRGYGLRERRFSLFNTKRWGNGSGPPEANERGLYVVPVLSAGTFNTPHIEDIIAALETHGSIAEPGFMNPEGIVVYHVASNQLFKKTLGGDDHKGESNG